MKINSEVILLFANIISYTSIAILLIKISIDDIKNRIIKDKMNFKIAAAGLVLLCFNCVFKNLHGHQLSFLTISVGIGEMLVEVTIRILFATIIPIVILCINGIVKDAFGGGDLKLIFALGIVFNFRELLSIIIISFIISGIFGIVVLICQKKKLCKTVYLPMAPFISIGTAICFICS